MQNKGAIRLFAVLLALVCTYQLYFSFKARQVRTDAVEYAKGDEAKEKYYLDSIAGQPVMNFMWIKDFTYKEVQEREMNLGLDLQGGMNVTLEVSVKDLIVALSNYSKDEKFRAALKKAEEMQGNSQDGFVDLFGKAYTEANPNAKLASIFGTLELKDKVKFNSTNNEVLSVIRTEVQDAIDNAFNIIRARIDRFGVAQPNIQLLQTQGRILVELPGVKEPERVRKLLQGAAILEFWETYENTEVFQFLNAANAEIKKVNDAAEGVAEEKKEEATKKEDKKDGSLEEMVNSEAAADSANVGLDNFKKNFPLWAVLSPSVNRANQPMGGPVVGMAHEKDTAQIGKYLRMKQVKTVLPRNLKLVWTAKPFDKGESFYQLIALKITSRDGRAPLSGDVIVDARQEISQSGAESEVDMLMNAEGAKAWARLTKENIGKCIAIVLDDAVQSYPRVNVEINGGRSQITGGFTVNEAKDLANILKSGKMPAKTIIVSEDTVGPSLGKEAIQSGLWSFVIAFALVLVYMIFFYSHAGYVANLALVANMFFIIGVLASLGAVLTLPGIAGIVLTIGMSVDANVLIYERVQEEVRAGKGLRLAIVDGYKNAYSAIIDGQVTTLLTGIVLFMFGSGPIKGFATTLIIGIFASLFSAIFITRLVIERRMDKEKKTSFASKLTENLFRTTNILFLEKRKVFYIISGVAILISIASFAIRGFDYSIDFKGGRTYVVRFEDDVKVESVSKALAAVYGSSPEVKTFGENNQVRITTDYKIEDYSSEVDNEVEAKMYEGLKAAGLVKSSVSKADFLANYRMQTQKVGPTISDDIKKDGTKAILFSLIIIFLYIVVRFRNWQYGLGALAALAHDSIIVLGIFSLTYGFLPFSLELDQAFIAAILTVVGYSINDTVVVFDRIREYIGLHPKRNREEIVDSALNSTLRRTFSTSLSTFVVLLAIFLFGGTSIKGFTFALLIGVAVGTYSSLFIASPIAYDTALRAQKVIDKKKK
ncbi:protein translocase subunit SecDF [Prolixibacteraceae bacterium JC049]|nr:protein translocase subunit SecDF [Prolixibacteraceae bacterium JC049]